MREEIHQAEADIAKLKEEITGLMSIQQMIKSGESKKPQIQLQKLHEQETKFLEVTQPWQDELAKLVQQVETKLSKFQETHATMGKLFT